MASKVSFSVALTVIVPVYNNASTLISLYKQIRQVLNQAHISFELLFVDDAGPDDSLSILSDMVNVYPEVSLVSMAHNVGQHAAVLHGLRFAKGRCCIVMDADLQDPSQALVQLMRTRSPHYQAIFAGRRGIYQSRSSMFTSRCYKTLIAYLTGIPRNAGIFVLMERPMVEALLEMPVRIPWINIMIGLSKLPLCSIPVTRNHREHGLSAYSGLGRLRSAINGLYCVLTYYLWRQPQSYLKCLKNDPVKWVKTGAS